MPDIRVIGLGREANRLEHDPAWVEAVGRVRASITSEWAQTNASEVSRREALHAELRALQRVIAALQATITDGNIERSQLPRRA